MSSRWDTIQGKKGRGIGHVTNEQKNAVISKAESKWKEMGLTQNEIAFGIATMGVESGFDPKAKSPDPNSTAEGLGQFLKGTWPDAVTEYNKKSNAHLKPDQSRHDPDAQLSVMGAWISKVWERAGKLWGTPGFQEYSHAEVAYGLWHTGADAPTNSVRKFLETSKDFTNNRDYHKTTYSEAQGIQGDNWWWLRGVPLTPSYKLDLAARREIKGLSQGLTIHSEIGETLRREGNQVWRIEGNGAVRGYFISE